jgi:hypothetical protein
MILVANCSASKRGEIPDTLQFRNLRPLPFSARFDAWIRAIEAHQNLIPALDLYKGDHWQSIRACANALSAFDSELWIISAGLGLIPNDAFIPPYSATFSRRVSDSVGEDIETARSWWGLLRQRNSRLGFPGSLTELHNRNPEAVFLLCLSSPYVEVLLPELKVLSAVASTQVAVFSAGYDQKNALDTLLPLNARYQSHVGGSRGSLNSRILLDVLKRLPADEINPFGIRKYLAKIAGELPPLRIFARKQCSDLELQERIATHLKQHRHASASSTLRAFRDQGLACERSRFHQLFKVSQNPITETPEQSDTAKIH